MALKMVWLVVLLLATIWGCAAGQAWTDGRDPGGGGHDDHHMTDVSATNIRIRSVRMGGKRVNVTIAALTPEVNETMVEAMSELIMAAESQAGKTRIGRPTDTWYTPQHAEEVYAPMPYSFAYDINDYIGNKQYRKETADGSGAVTGSYGFWAPDGIYRHVDYVADHNGFRAQVKTTEPGTSPQNPADVKMQADPVSVAPQPHTVPKVYPARKLPPTHAAPVARVVPSYAPPPPVEAYEFSNQFGSGGEYDWRREGQVRAAEDLPLPASKPWYETSSAHSSGGGSGGGGSSGRGKSIVTGTSKSRRPGQRQSIPQGYTRYQTQPPPIVEQIQIKESIHGGRVVSGKTHNPNDISFRTVYSYPREGRTFTTQGTMTTHPSNPPPTTITAAPPAHYAPPVTTTFAAAPPAESDNTVTGPAHYTVAPLITTTSHPHDGNVLKNGPILETFTVTPQRLHKVRPAVGFGNRLHAPHSTPSGPEEHEVTTIVSNSLDEHGHSYADRPDHFDPTRFNRRPEHVQYGGHIQDPHGTRYDYRGPPVALVAGHASQDPQNPVLDWRIAKAAVEKEPTRRRKIEEPEQPKPKAADHRAPEPTPSTPSSSTTARDQPEYFVRMNYDDREWHPFRAAAGRKRRHHNHFGDITTEAAVEPNTVTDNRSRYGYTIYNPKMEPIHSDDRNKDEESKVYYAEEHDRSGSSESVAKKLPNQSIAFREVATDSHKSSESGIFETSGSAPKPWVRQFYAGESVYGYGVPTLRDHMNEFLHLDYADDDEETSTESSVTPSIVSPPAARPSPSPRTSPLQNPAPARVRPAAARSISSVTSSTSLKFGDRKPKTEASSSDTTSTTSHHKSNNDRKPVATEWIKMQNSGGGTPVSW